MAFVVMSPLTTLKLAMKPGRLTPFQGLVNRTMTHGKGMIGNMVALQSGLPVHLTLSSTLPIGEWGTRGQIGMPDSGLETISIIKLKKLIIPKIINPQADAKGEVTVSNLNSDGGSVDSI